MLVVPNFSIGAVLIQRFASMAAANFASVEVIELHHDRKRDAPSGTSLATAGALATARAANGLRDVVDRPPTAPSRSGGVHGPGGIRVHSVRLPGLLAHQEVLFGAPGEGLVLRHDTYDRAAFMPRLLLRFARRRRRRRRDRARARARRVSATEARERILEGTSRAICQQGVRQTPLEDIARELGLLAGDDLPPLPGRSRRAARRARQLRAPTVLRAPRPRRRGRDDARGGRRARPHGRAPRGEGARGPPDRPAQQPELLEPTLVRTGRPTLALVADFLEPFLKGHGSDDPDQRRRDADFLARMVLSHISAPGRWDLEDAVQVRRLVRCQLLAGLST